MTDVTEFNLVPDNEEEEFAVDFGEVINVGGGGGTSDFNSLTNRPKYNNQTMTGSTNIPKVPTKTSELSNDSDYQTGSQVTQTVNTAIGELDIPTETSDLINDGSDGSSTYVEADDLATVATSGSYNDLNNKPTIPAAQVQSDWTQSDNTKVDYIKNKPTIPAAQVNSDWSAESGVAEILNKPTIPTVNDATLTITQNGVSKGTFTANDADDTTIEVADTTYSAFTGTDGNTDGSTGLVPAPETTDAGKFLCADGTWATAGGDSGIKTLTTADYNYPTNNPTTVALWLLNDGIYRTESDSVSVSVAGSGIEGISNTWQKKSIYFFVSTKGNNKDISILHNNQGGANGYFQAVSNFRINASNGNQVGSFYNAITQLKNDLNATSSHKGYALDARQGGVIKNYFAKTSYYVNINDLPTSPGTTAQNVTVYTNIGLTTPTSAQVWYNQFANELNIETQKLVLVDTSEVPSKQIILNPVGFYKPNPNVVSPSTTTTCEMDFQYYDMANGQVVMLRMWVDGTADFQFELVE